MTSTGPSVDRHVKETEPLAVSRRNRERLGIAAAILW
jgi:hypothetical protein